MGRLGIIFSFLFYYLCEYVLGEPKLGKHNEFETMKKGNQTYEPVWVKIEELPQKLLYPLEIRDWIIQDYKTDFKDVPKTATLEFSTLR